jgi:hypothetical protein
MAVQFGVQDYFFHSSYYTQKAGDATPSGLSVNGAV